MLYIFCTLSSFNIFFVHVLSMYDFRERFRSVIQVPGMTGHVRDNVSGSPPLILPVSAARPGSVGSDTQHDERDQFFSEKGAPYSERIRDKFGRRLRSGRTPERRLGFFDFLQQKRWDTVTHKTLVPGSSPGGPTISL